MKLAAFDVGTNTVLMLVAEQQADGTVHRVLDRQRITRLGQGVDSSHHLDPQAALRTLDTVAEFADEARNAGVEKILAVGTSTLRDASDGESFINRLRERTGIELEIISGEAEAWLSYLAVTHGLRLDTSKRILIVDIGGGSTEFIRAEPGAKLQMVSLQMGSVRLTERLIHHDPPTAREAADLRIAIDEALQTLGWELKPDVIVGIAGTVTTVCGVALELESYDPDRVHGYRLSRKEVERVLGLFGSVPIAERRKLKGLEPARADVIFAGTAILERVMSECEAEYVMVSDQGVRWGLIWRELGDGALRSNRS
jgi:exopolyphosphatase/guanosine-5'-triphosphate,3'-diphosphate pyrophosphatase